ncbi:MAG: SBBP repeat-containing protein [Bacteroidales bacterium]
MRTILILKKAIFTGAVISLFAITANSQTNLVWGKQFGTDKNEYVMNHVVDQHGNIYISGTTSGKMNGTNYGQNDGFISKIDSSGNLLWSKQFGTAEDEDIQWSAIDNKGCIYITGYTNGDLNGKSAGKEDILVAKYNSDGKMLWSKQLGTDSTDMGKGIFADNKGNVYITGLTLGKLGKSSFGKSDGFIIKLDGNGKLLFTNQFGTPGDDCSNAITGDNKSTIYTCGTTWGDLGSKSKGFIDVFITRITENGNLIKYDQFGSEGFDIAMAIKTDKENNIYVGGTTSGNFANQQLGEGDCFLVKMNDKGEIIWNKQFGTDKHDGIRAININAKVSDNILVSGLLSLPPAQAFIRSYNKTGELIWEKNFNDKNADSSGKDVSIDNNGIIYHSGLTQGSLFGKPVGEGDFYIVKLRLDKKLE